MGRILVDEGYGDFDRCISVLKVLRKDIDGAREILGQLTFSEARLAYSYWLVKDETALRR